MIRLTAVEKRLSKRLVAVKRKSGSHSPSPAMLARVKGVKVQHDFCFLSNPHATELFLKHFKRDFKDGRKLRSLVEHYPSQNRALAEKLAESPLLKGAPPTFSEKRGGGLSPLARGALSSSTGGVLQPPPSLTRAPSLLRGITTPASEDRGTPFTKGDNIFVGNGATEVIQAVLQNFVGVRLPQSRGGLTPTKLLVPVPTFSPYLEFVPKGVRVIRHQLRKEANFKLEPERFLADIQREKPNTVVIINPNNPDGGYHSANDLQSVLEKLRGVETVIVDESFSHFVGRNIKSVAPLIKKYPNLVVIKSLSKDFGIAGLRLGYGIMSESRVSTLLERGYLWNVSGFGEYFLDLLNRKDFLRGYEQARLKAIEERDEFFAELSNIRGITVYPSKANAFLVELLEGTKASDLMVRLLVRYGIYVRDCYDKVGLKGEFIRVASRRREENKKLIQALMTSFS